MKGGEVFMKKENKLSTIMVIGLFLTMVCVISVAGTYAKYSSSATGSDTATVAKWSFKVNNKEIAVTGTPATISFDLFSTINDEDGLADETDVSDNKIAPGTSGSFNLELQNTSEVTTQYAIDYTVTKSDSTLPIQFSVDGGTTWTDDLSDIVASDSTKLAIGSAKEVITVQWKWAFNDSDTAVDTALGVAAQTTAPTVTVSATVTASQVN